MSTLLGKFLYDSYRMYNQKILKSLKELWMPRQKSSTKSNQLVGRPRCLDSEQAILAATWRLLQTYSVRKLSIEAIAQYIEQVKK